MNFKTRLRLAVEDKETVYKKIEFLKNKEDYLHIDIKECIFGIDLCIESKDEKFLQIAAYQIRRVFLDDIYTEGEQSLEEVISYLLYLRGKTLCCAESCTGGLLSDLLTNTPGASNFFKGSIIAYSDKSKVDILGISESLIDKRGSVDREVAELMCEKAASLFSADIALSITGIAGPTSYKNLPVGLVYIGLYFEGKTEVEECRYSPSESRRIIKLKAAYKALDILRRRLLTY